MGKTSEPMPSAAARITRLDEKKNADLFACLVQSPSRNKAVTAVVAAAADESDALCPGILGDTEIGNRHSRIFHQSCGRNSKLLGGRAIDFVHFGSGDDLHEAAVTTA